MWPLPGPRRTKGSVNMAFRYADEVSVHQLHGNAAASFSPAVAARAQGLPPCGTGALGASRRGAPRGVDCGISGDAYLQAAVRTPPPPPPPQPQPQSQPQSRTLLTVDAASSLQSMERERAVAVYRLCSTVQTCENFQISHDLSNCVFFLKNRPRYSAERALRG